MEVFNWGNEKLSSYSINDVLLCCPLSQNTPIWNKPYFLRFPPLFPPT
jgi:hypothetical protein